MIEIAAGKKFTENYKEKHTIDAMYGWYHYESRFALPVFDEVGEIERYNVFKVLKNMLGWLANSESSFLMKRKH